MTKGQIFTGLPRLRLAMTRVMKGRELVVWGVGLRGPIPTCVGMTKKANIYWIATASPRNDKGVRCVMNNRELGICLVYFFGWGVGVLTVQTTQHL